MYGTPYNENNRMQDGTGMEHLLTRTQLLIKFPDIEVSVKLMSRAVGGRTIKTQ
jgi:hypothetical protein